MTENRGPWYLLTGLILGLGVGLLLAWVILPVSYVASTPTRLRNDFKDEYRYLIASAYTATGNLERARARLAVLEEGEAVKVLGDQAQRMLADNTQMKSVRPLAALGEALQANPVATSQPTETSLPATDTSTPALPTEATSATAGLPTVAGILTDTPYPTGTPDALTVPTLEETLAPSPLPSATFTQRPSQTPTSTPGMPFELASQTTFCEPTQPGLLKIYLFNSAGQPAAGVEMTVTWDGGTERFFTGLKPEIGPGYADFTMLPEVEYALSPSNSPRITGLMTTACTAANGNTYPGGLRLEFHQQ